MNTAAETTELAMSISKVSCLNQARTMIRLHICGIQEKVLRSRLRSSDHGPHSDEEITEALTNLILLREVTVGMDGRLHLAEQPEEIPLGFLQAADNCRRVRELRRTRCGCFLLWLEGKFPSIAPGLCLLIITVSLTVGLSAQDVPAWVVRGIAAVETGTEWTDIGNVRGTWERGAIGEVGPWQLSPAVLRDLKAYDRRERVHTCPVLAESLTRAWLLHLYARTGSWWEACAAYNAGLGNRWSASATDYANRVTAAGIAAEGYGPSHAAGAAR